MERDPRIRRSDQEAATVIIQLLKLDDSIESVIADLVEIDRSDVQATYAFEVDSSVGELAFLIYIFDYVGAAGPSARVAYADGVGILETAAMKNTPGPRMVSAYETSEAGVILATTPAAYERLEQNAAVIADKPGPAPAPARVWKSEAERTSERREQAERLLRAIKAADRAAGRWLEAVNDGDARIPAETELLLYLADERSIASLLQVLEYIVTANDDVRG